MIKNFINRFIPNSILKSRQKYLIKKQRNKFAKSNMRESFREFYFKRSGFKEGENYSEFNSGPGSHKPEVVRKMCKKKLVLIQEDKTASVNDVSIKDR